ncbi:MAG: PilN domain-containing protein [Candidatus Binataceae bacterium]|nr:PilN domain-containing protein [Candidatus Binataceae bacterium]
MAQRIMALEIDGDSVRAAVAERSWNSFALIGLFENQRTSAEPDNAGALSRLVTQTGHPDVVLSALPAEFVAKRLLQLPFSDRRRLNQVVPFALEEHLPFPVDDAVVAFSRLGRDGDTTRVVAAYARRSDVKDHLDLLGRAGIDPKTITLSALALSFLVAQGRNGHQGAHLIVNIDQSSASIILLDTDGAPRAIRTVGIATPSPSRGGAKQLPIAPAAAVLNSLRQMLLSHQIETDDAELILTGSAATTARIKAQLSEALALNVRAAEDFDLGRPFGGVPTDAGRFGGCLSMLLGEMPTRPAELLNFRQGEFAFRGRSGDLAPLRLSFALAAGIAFFAIVNFALGVSVDMARANAIGRQIAIAAEPALGSAANGNAHAVLTAEIMKMRKQLKSMGNNTGQNSPLDALAAMSRALPRGIPVEMTDLTISDGAIKVTGKADSYTTIDQVKAAFNRSGYFAQIQVTDAKASSAESGKIDFRLSATMGEGGAE